MQKQFNVTSKLAYQGNNQVTLLTVSEKKLYQSHLWGTFVQWRMLGFQIKKGEHGTHIFKGFQSFDEKDPKTGRITTVSRPAGWANVFNQDQTEQVIKEAK